MQIDSSPPLNPRNVKDELTHLAVFGDQSLSLYVPLFIALSNVNEQQASPWTVKSTRK